ncbi:MAG TPA: CARDB domain-containing protein, partial [Candidatus Acidoferrales bacterium]|nr:CARDB domain-containing protein [Candidatus Acidoferrales bacterium]
MKNLIRKFFQQGLLTLLIFLPALLAAQQPPAAPQQPAADTGSSVPQQNAAQNNQAISQSGLLPVYGVDVRLDPAWVDSAQFPSQSPNFQNSGTSAAFQQVWGALQPGGYNAMRVPVDVRDAAGAANRAANLCVWAKNNNVQLILLLTGSDAGQPIGQDFPTQVSNFVQSLVTLMRSNSGQYLSNYSQIMSYQIEDELNHAGRHGGMAPAAAQQLVLQAAQALRKAETDALNGSGLAATPLMASTSFDFELITAGAIAGGTLTDAAYNQAYQSLKQILAGLAGSSNLDLLSVDWFAGSVGGGGVEKAPQLLRSLIADVTGKQLVLTTGFSTAFRSPDEQKRLYTMAFANLSDLRASAGADCPFVGTIFREALNGNNANPNPPRPTLPGEMDKWDWKAKAAELSAMWTQGKNSNDMSWWLAKVENNMGLVTLQNDASGNVAVNPLPAQQGMTQIASTVGDVNASMAANPAMNFNGQPTNPPSNPSTDPNANSYGQQQPPPANPYANPAVDANGQPIPQPAQPGTGGTGSTPSAFMMGLQGAVQKGMLGLLDGVFQRLSMMSAPGGGQGFNNANNPAAQYNNAYNNNPGQQPGNPYNYYNDPGTQAAGQPATNYGAQPGQQAGYPGGQPGGATPGSVQLGPQDVTLQPMNPQVGSPVTINVNLQNIGMSDVYGLTVMAVGDDNLTLGQMNSVHIAPNSSTPVTLQWVPAVAKPSYQITVNVGDGSGNQLASAPLSPIAVTAMQAPNNPGTGAAGSGNNPGGTGADTSGGASPTGGATGAAGSGTGASGNNSPAGSQLLPGGGADPGGVGTSGTSGGALSTVIPMGAVKVDGVQVGNASQGPSSGQQTPVVVAVSNPYLVPLSNIKATLLVDGKPVQTQTMGALLPQQNRSLLFQGVNFPQAGQHEVKVTVDSQRPGAQPQTGTATQQIVVPAGTTTVAGGQSAGGATGAGGTAAGATGGAAGGANSSAQGTTGTAVGTTGKVRLGPSMKPPVRSVMPPSFQVGQVIVPTGTGPTGATGATRTPIVGMPPVKPGTTVGTSATGATPTTPPTGAPLKSGATGTAGAIVGMPPVRSGTTAGTPNAGATGATPAPHIDGQVKPGATGTNGAVVGMPPRPGAPVTTGTTGATPTPPTGAPVRSIGGGGATTPPPPNTGLPPRPGAPATTGTTGATPTPPTGAPVRSIGGGGATTPPP